jgi:hypothetical protein
MVSLLHADLAEDYVGGGMMAHFGVPETALGAPEVPELNGDAAGCI